MSRFCIQYHNYENELNLRLPLPKGNDYHPFIDGRPPAIYKLPKIVERHEGSTVFLILGIDNTKGRSPRRLYYLWNTFVIDNSEPDGDHFIAAGPGYMLNPPQQLKGADFDAFKDKCARFVRSFKDISHLPYTATLRRLAERFHRPNKIDEKTRAFCDELHELKPNDPGAQYLQGYVKKLLGNKSSVDVTYESEDESADNELVATVPANDEQEEIRRVNRLIIARQGQPEFRDALIEAYNGKCAVTGWDAIPALEAAHIKPHTGPRSNVVSNGLLLRSDIHTLFDLG